MVGSLFVSCLFGVSKCPALVLSTLKRIGASYLGQERPNEFYTKFTVLGVC